MLSSLEKPLHEECFITQSISDIDVTAGGSSY
jgi:hypothetical protein